MIYQHPQETWDEKTCARLAKRRWRDGMGTQMRTPGYLGCNQPYSEHSFGLLGQRQFINGESYEDEFFPFPILAPGYEIKWVVTWGWFIVKTKEADKREHPADCNA